MPSPWLCQIFLPLLQRGCQKLLVLGKTLSENCQVEQDVTAGKLNKRQPVLGLLCPARTEAATLAQPRDRALHHPSPCRMRLLWGDLFFLQRFATRFGTLAPSGIDLDVSCVASAEAKNSLTSVAS